MQDRMLLYLVGAGCALDISLALFALATLALAASLPLFYASHLGFKALCSLAAGSTGSWTAFGAAAAGCWCLCCDATLQRSRTR